MREGSGRRRSRGMDPRRRTFPTDRTRNPIRTGDKQTVGRMPFGWGRPADHAWIVRGDLWPAQTGRLPAGVGGDGGDKRRAVVWSAVLKYGSSAQDSVRTRRANPAIWRSLCPRFSLGLAAHAEGFPLSRDTRLRLTCTEPVRISVWSSGPVQSVHPARMRRFSYTNELRMAMNGPIRNMPRPQVPIVMRMANTPTTIRATK